MLYTFLVLLLCLVNVCAQYPKTFTIEKRPNNWVFHLKSLEYDKFDHIPGVTWGGGWLEAMPMMTSFDVPVDGGLEALCELQKLGYHDSDSENTRHEDPKFPLFTPLGAPGTFVCNAPQGRYTTMSSRPSTSTEPEVKDTAPLPTRQQLQKLFDAQSRNVLEYSHRPLVGEVGTIQKFGKILSQAAYSGYHGLTVTFSAETAKLPAFAELRKELLEDSKVTLDERTVTKTEQVVWNIWWLELLDRTCT